MNWSEFLDLAGYGLKMALLAMLVVSPALVAGGLLTWLVVSFLGAPQ